VLDEIAQLVGDGKLKIIIDEVFEFTKEGVVKILEKIESGKSLGKNLIKF
jgi:hypothetical protein